MQGEKYIYSTLFVKINWSMKEIEVPLLKHEKRVKVTKAKPLKLEEASRSATSIETISSTASIQLLQDEAVLLETGESSGGLVAKISEVSEAKEKLL